MKIQKKKIWKGGRVGGGQVRGEGVGSGWM